MDRNSGSRSLVSVGSAGRDQFLERAGMVEMVRTALEVAEEAAAQ
jgi:hypothetical protein